MEVTMPSPVIDQTREVQRPKDFSDLQDVFGDVIRRKVFTPICLCYAMRDELRKTHVIDTLTRGLEQLAISFPWLAGRVNGEEGTGLPKIFPGEGKCILLVKDLSDDRDGGVPCMDVLREAKFPFSMLDGSILTPTEDLPTSWTDPPVPVFIVQATFIKGGLIISVVGEHTSMDGVGLGRVLQMLSRACYGETFTEEQLLHGNSARTNMIPSLEQSVFESYPRLDHMIVSPETVAFYLNYQIPQTTWAYLHFSVSSLAQLKKLASNPTSITGDLKVPYITTNDAVTAFIWKKVAQARAARLLPGTSCMLVRAVDARPCLSISPHYLGNMTHHTYTRLLASSANSTPLGVLASSLRSALNPEDLARGLRAIVTLLKTTADKSPISYGADFNLSSDMWFSSWAKLDCYHLDFNLGLGLPEAVRKPNSGGSEGLGYLMPMDREGGVDAAICLRNEDIEALKEDSELKEYAKWIG